MNSMTLSSLWKYFLFGFFLIIYCSGGTSNSLSFYDNILVQWGQPCGIYIFGANTGLAGDIGDGDRGATGFVSSSVCLVGRHDAQLLHNIQGVMIIIHTMNI